MMRLLATTTTSLPLNFFSSSRTSRCWILWKFFSRRKGTCSTKGGDTGGEAAAGAQVEVEPRAARWLQYDTRQMQLGLVMLPTTANNPEKSWQDLANSA